MSRWTLGHVSRRSTRLRSPPTGGVWLLRSSRFAQPLTLARFVSVTCELNASLWSGPDRMSKVFHAGTPRPTPSLAFEL